RDDGEVPGALQSGDRAEPALPVDDQRTLGAVLRQLQPGSVDAGQLGDLDLPRCDCPDAVPAQHGLRAVGRVEGKRIRQRLDAVGALLDREVVVRERDEAGTLALELTGERRDLDPLARPVHAVDAGLVPGRARVLARGIDEPALARKSLVQRLPLEDHAPLCSALRRGSRRRLSRYSFTSRMSLSVRPSMEARMSFVAVRTRSGCPFVKTVTSATWFSRIDGLRST